VYLANNIFCLEGDREGDLRKKTSILSGLEMLHSISDVEFFYFFESTLFDVLYFNELICRQQKRPLIKHIDTKYAGFKRDLGFRIF